MVRARHVASCPEPIFRVIRYNHDQITPLGEKRNQRDEIAPRLRRETSRRQPNSYEVVVEFLVRGDSHLHHMEQLQFNESDGRLTTREETHTSQMWMKFFLCPQRFGEIVKWRMRSTMSRWR